METIKKPLIIKSKLIGKLSLSVTKTTYFYDIILEGTRMDLLKAKQKLKSDVKIIDEGVFGIPVMVLDEFSTFSDAKESFKIYLNKL